MHTVQDGTPAWDKRTPGQHTPARSDGGSTPANNKKTPSQYTPARSDGGFTPARRRPDWAELDFFMQNRQKQPPSKLSTAKQWYVYTIRVLVKKSR